VLNAAARQQESIQGVPEFRGLRGIARAMVGRDKEAESDFATAILGDDPSAFVWRGYLAARAGQWADARTKFGHGAMAISQFSPIWKARFLAADAESALELGDLAAAQTRVDEALAESLPAKEQLAVRLIQARLFEAQGRKTGALGIYLAIAKAPLDQLAAPAMLRATRLKQELGKITPVQAAATYDGLRYRWRGDATELETIRTLGQLYLSQGRYREGAGGAALGRHADAGPAPGRAAAGRPGQRLPRPVPRRHGRRSGADPVPGPVPGLPGTDSQRRRGRP
jgi:tetratricopeptide (TPR) repeat protein